MPERKNKVYDMSNTTQRIIAGAFMLLIAGGVAVLQYFGLPAVRVLSVLIVVGMIAEMLWCLYRTPRDVRRHGRNMLVFGGFVAWLFVMLAAAYFIGARPWIILLLLLIIGAADIGAWAFGKLIGGDKMWERLSAGKTWSGQIAGIICGTLAAVMYGLLGTDMFMPQLMWIGISVALFSQYGDLTASMIKRRMGIKDFGRLIPGHGGLLDRFDGWIYVLPIIWLVTL